ncbi:hypothetical protein IQ247_25870 [Plectonema cf. radiosum LEGE 06105]|uniref:Uncharacterized protein n=1 Tax=Plectonema cf. radiosum LEGE 06105 TaxID=945769 RepID=A0A8J7F798_9CYAN|nr:hypothetical protein [Plectonema radiosum]MBE9216048.1 hypothetical protein [Plectonema cf. radiosum LEGE 06105]
MAQCNGISHAGIVYCHQNQRSIGEIISYLVLMWEVLDSEEMRNQLEFVGKLLIKHFNSQFPITD